MLQALIEYAEREGLGDADFHEVSVRWLVPLDALRTSYRRSHRITGQSRRKKAQTENSHPSIYRTKETHHCLAPACLLPVRHAGTRGQLSRP